MTVLVDAGYSVTTEVVGALHPTATAFTGESAAAPTQLRVDDTVGNEPRVEDPGYPEEPDRGGVWMSEDFPRVHDFMDSDAGTRSSDDLMAVEHAAEEGDKYSAADADEVDDDHDGIEIVEGYSEAYAGSEQAAESRELSPEPEDLISESTTELATEGGSGEEVFEAVLEQTGYDSDLDEYAGDEPGRFAEAEREPRQDDDVEQVEEAQPDEDSDYESAEHYESVARSESASVFLATEEPSTEAVDADEPLHEIESRSGATSRVEVAIDEPIADAGGDEYQEEPAEDALAQTYEPAGTEEISGVEPPPALSTDETAPEGSAVAAPDDQELSGQELPDQAVAEVAPVREEAVAAELDAAEGFAEVPSRSDADLTLPPAPFGSSDPHARARRLARALVSDIVVYHPDRRERSIRLGTIRQEFREEIRKSWDEYVAHVGNQMARETAYFRDALNELLAGGGKVF